MGNGLPAGVAEVLLAWLLVFLAAATPWLEVLFVVPAAIIAGLPAPTVVVVAAAGNVATLVPLVFGLERMRAWWRRRRGAQHAQGEGSPRGERARRVFDRYGLPGLAVLGPLVTGVHVAAMAAIAVGAPRRATAVWLSGGVAVWAVLTGALTVFGVELFFEPEQLPDLGFEDLAGT